MSKIDAKFGLNEFIKSTLQSRTRDRSIERIAFDTRSLSIFSFHLPLVNIIEFECMACAIIQRQADTPNRHW